jgi:outer membrane lipoprotein carrier protein
MNAPWPAWTPFARLTHRRRSHGLGRPAAAALALCLALLASGARADGLARLHAFMADTRAGQADFTQQVAPRAGRTPAPVSGHLAFQRPGLFRWEASQPYHQLIVADSQHVWLWDPDLNQVTVKPQAKALGASPAALLAGDNARMERDFQLFDRGSADGLEWAEAVPRGSDVGFDSIRLGFAGAALARMDLKDSFGQTTRVTFGRFAPLGPRDAALFQFHTPTGADEIRE